MNPLKNAWLWVIGIIAALLGALKISNSQRNAARAEAELSDAKIEDAKIQTILDQNDAKMHDLERKRKKLIEKDPSLADLSPEEIEDYWNKS